MAAQEACQTQIANDHLAVENMIKRMGDMFKNQSHFPMG